MEQARGSRQQPIGPTLRSVAQTALADEAQADAILDSAQEAQAEQLALLEATPLESQYEAAFAAEVEAKHDQAEHLEDRLESLLDQQASRLQRTQSGRPGLFSVPGARDRWQADVQQQQRTLQRLHDRLEAVREIKEGMGVHGSRIDELATRKLRARDPALAREWDDMCEAQRQHHALLRKQEHDKKLERSQREQASGQPLRRGLHLGLSQPR